MKILDLAAGTGASSVKLREAGAEVVSCDFSVGMLRVGKRRYPELDLIAGDALRLPFADETFDVVTISWALRNVNDVTVALTEMLRVTKPGGRLVVLENSHPTWKPFRVGLPGVHDARGPGGREGGLARTPRPTTTWPSRSAPGPPRSPSPTRSRRPAGPTSSGAT